MPKIADIQETPNPNAVKFILKEAVSHGTSHSFDSAEKAVDDALAKSLFEIGDVVSVFYMDKMITVEKTDEADWDEILPILAVPISYSGRYFFELSEKRQHDDDCPGDYLHHCHAWFRRDVYGWQSQ